MNPYELRQRLQNFVRTSGDTWWKVVNKSDGPSQILIYNSIGGIDGTKAVDFANAINGIDGPVDIRINSEGGEVFQAKAIYNALACRQDVAVYIDGIAASAASFIAMAASPGKLFMSAIGSMMIHDGQTVAMGNSLDIRALADILDRESNAIAGIYASRTGKTAEYFRGKMQAETWYNALEALEEGLIDGILDPRTGNVMNKAAAKVTNAASHPYVGRSDHMHEPMTGHHSHNHAAFGHSDGDDGIHDHSHFHDGDATHAHEHMSHSHDHDHGLGDDHHGHAHDAGQDSWGAEHDHTHTHHAGHERYDPDHDGDDDSSAATDTDHDGGRAGEGHEDTGSHPPHVSRANASSDVIVLASSFPEAAFYNRTFTTEQRKSLAKKGHALPDGSYPIENCQDAHNAREAYGRSNQGDRSKVAAHIRSREKALGGCGSESFSPGADNTNSLVITDEEAVLFAANLKL